MDDSKVTFLFSYNHTHQMIMLFFFGSEVLQVKAKI